MMRKWIPEITSAILYLSVTYAAFYVSARFLIHHQVPEQWVFMWTQLIAFIFGMLRIPFLKYRTQRRVLNFTLQTIFITLLTVAYIYLLVERTTTFKDNPSLPYPSVLQLLTDMSWGVVVFNAVVVHLDDYFNIRRGKAMAS